MEIILNIFWGLIAVGAFWFWRSEKYRGAPGSRSTTPLGVLALACALILLFPVISLTDDLHAEQAVMEDGSGCVVKASVVTQGGSRSGRFHFSSIVAAPGTLVAVLVVVSQVLPVQFHLHWILPIPPSHGRAPPVQTA
jgi:hypothetical protein